MTSAPSLSVPLVAVAEPAAAAVAVAIPAEPHPADDNVPELIEPPASAQQTHNYRIALLVGLFVMNSVLSPVLGTDPDAPSVVFALSVSTVSILAARARQPNRANFFQNVLAIVLIWAGIWGGGRRVYTPSPVTSFDMLTLPGSFLGLIPLQPSVYREYCQREH